MPETTTWDKLGQVTWRVEIGLDDGDDPMAETAAEAEYPARSLGLAKIWAAKQLLARTNPPPKYDGGNPGSWWARLRRGTYLDDSFDDRDDGHVSNATWEPDVDRNDTHIELMAYLTEAGALAWQDPDFVPTKG